MDMIEQLISQFPQSLQQQASQVLPCSLYLQKQLTKHPEWIEMLMQPIDTQAFMAEKMAATAHEADLLSQIRLLRHHNLCRIAWQDLTHQVSLTQTLADTSSLADALLKSANDWWYEELAKHHGYPVSPEGQQQRMVILGMGKLGGNELNFSSDIDLIFAFPEKGSTQGKRPVDNATFFARLGQKLIMTFSKMTAEGFAYRVDMRLRPFGDSGALALSFAAMEHYYQQHGRDWERYAFIKARAITNQTQGGELLDSLKPFVYRRYLDYGAISQLRVLKLSIEKERLAEADNNIKVGKGGIREIEFIVQLFQLIRGGRESYLQQGSLLKTLPLLEAHDFLTASKTHSLTSAYRLFRKVENRLQMWDDQQTHRLPEDPERLRLLAHNLGYANSEVLISDVQAYRQQVMMIFNEQFFREESADAQLYAQIRGREQWQQRLSELGYADAENLAAYIDGLFQGRLYQHLTTLGQHRFNTLLPVLVEACAKDAEADTALSRSLQVVEKIATRSGYIALLCENLQALALLVTLVSKSQWVAQQIGQSPILLDELLSAAQLYQPLNRQQLSEELQAQLGNMDANDTEQIMERLRTFKQSQVFSVAATDLMGKLPLMKVSDQLTWIAEVIVEETQRVAWNELVAKYGEPCFMREENRQTADFAIIGYGKLGGIELGYESDLDIIFLHNSRGTKQQTNGEKSVDNQVFFTRLAQRIVFILNTYTMGGRLYEIDTRLRPSGASGLLVASVKAFKRYQLKKAWTWEHQAIVRGRGIAGSARLIKDFDDIRQTVLLQAANSPNLRTDIREMREKMWSQYPPKSGLFHLKKQAGGITDIEFLVQYWVLKSGDRGEYVYTDNIRLLATLAANGCIEESIASRLTTIYITMRDRIHALSLQGQSAEVDEKEFQQERAFVQQCWQQFLT